MTTPSDDEIRATINHLRDPTGVPVPSEQTRASVTTFLEGFVGIKPVPEEPTPDNVYDTVEELCEESEGYVATWEDLVNCFGEEREEAVEDALNTLMDRGRVFEPVLGKLKPT